MKVNFKTLIKPETIDYKVGDIIKNSHNGLLVISNIVNNNVYLMGLDKNKEYINRIYIVTIDNVINRLNKGSYLIVGKSEIPTIELELY